MFSGLYLNELLVRLLHRYDPHPRLFAAYAATLDALAATTPSMISCGVLSLPCSPSWVTVSTWISMVAAVRPCSLVPGITTTPNTVWWPGAGNGRGPAGVQWC